MIQFETPCGYQITLEKRDDGTIGIYAMFEGVAESFLDDCKERLSGAGARMLAKKIGELYGI